MYVNKYEETAMEAWLRGEAAAKHCQQERMKLLPFA